jgi:hypothetical protein
VESLENSSKPKLNIERIKQLAKFYGLEVKENSSDPGVHIIDKDGSSRKIETKELVDMMFPGTR